MEQIEQTSAERSQQTSPPDQELVRPRSGRVIAGVAQGLSNKFGVPLWLVRGAFIVLSIGGGFGVLLYALGWLLIRSEDEATTPMQRLLDGNANGGSNWLPIALIVVGALVLVGSFNVFSGETLLAAALLTAGILMYTGHIPGSTAKADGSPTEGVSVESKEGVQQMTTTTEDTKQLVTDDDSPVDGPPPSPPVPTPTPPAPPAPPKDRSILGRLTIGVTMLALAVLAILDNVESIAIDAEPRHYVALATVGVGAGLVVGAFAGRARWLIIVGAILVPVMLTSPVFEVDFDSDRFDRVVAPDTFVELDPVYELDAGDLLIDLTELPWDGEIVELAANVDIGQIRVWVPRDIRLEGEADVDIGRVQGPNRESFGFGDPTVDFALGDDANGTVVLDLHVDAGNIEVIRVER